MICQLDWTIRNNQDLLLVLKKLTFFFSLFCFFCSFVPPVRDEESETQRIYHAKRVRETRRSTQGVTLEEVKTAEQLAKKKQAETVGFKNNKSLLATNQLDIGGKKNADYFNTFS